MNIPAHTYVYVHKQIYRYINIYIYIYISFRYDNVTHIYLNTCVIRIVRGSWSCLEATGPQTPQAWRACNIQLCCAMLRQPFYEVYSVIMKR